MEAIKPITRSFLSGFVANCILTAAGLAAIAALAVFEGSHPSKTGAVIGLVFFGLACGAAPAALNLLAIVIAGLALGSRGAAGWIAGWVAVIPLAVLLGLLLLLGLFLVGMGLSPDHKWIL